MSDDDSDDVFSDTLTVTDGEFTKLLEKICANSTVAETHLSAGRIIVETADGDLELTAADGTIEKENCEIRGE